MQTVLVVDDEPDMREALALVLHDEGFATATAENGAEALAWLRANPRPAVVLLDLMMPVMDGFRFLEEHRKDPELAQVPVVVLTAGSTGEAAARARAAAFFTKPVRLPELIDTVKRLAS